MWKPAVDACWARRCCAVSLRRSSAASLPRARAPSTGARVALLIDGDQVGPKAFQPLLLAAEPLGEMVVKRCYVTTSKARDWGPSLQDAGIDAVVVPRKAGGSKDPVDLEIALEAADLALGPSRPDLSALVIASNDVDLISVLRYVRKWGLNGYLAVLKDSSATEPGAMVKAAAAQAGVSLMYYSLEGGVSYPSAVVTMDGVKSSVSFETEEALAPIHMDDIRMSRVRDTLLRHGYIQDGQRSIMAAEIAKFFLFNNLGPLVVYPLWRGLAQVDDALASCPAREWVRDPGDWVYVEPVGSQGSGTALRRRAGTSQAARLASGGGPFLLRSSPGLVREVLSRMGFLEPGGALGEAIGGFCVVNGRRLQKCGVDVRGLDADGCEAALRGVFGLQAMRQQWRTPPSDQKVREALCAAGLLPAAGAPRAEVQRAARAWLAQRGEAAPPAGGYLECVARVVRHMERCRPDLRK